MTAQVLPQKAGNQVAFFTSTNFDLASKKKGYWYTKADGAKAYRMEGVAVFRSGTFRDSWGEQHTYDPFHIETLANNFSLLSSSGTFPDPPIRCNHPGLFTGGGLDQVIGYIDTLKAEKLVSPVDGVEYSYLLASYDVLDEEAARKIDSGLWRNRSAEIGFYETNDGAEFWPVLTGFAYVDIPAVEGLNFSNHVNRLPGIGEAFYAVAGDKESAPMGDENKTQTGASSIQGNPPAPTPPPTPPAPAAPAVPATAPTVEPQVVFSINGTRTVDFAAVQAHITKLETENGELKQFASETQEAARNAFVKGLAEGDAPKIFASQVAGLQGLVKTMTDEQFGLFKASYEDAPAQPALGKQFVAPQSSGDTAGQPEPVDEELESARRIYNRHTLSGAMTADQLAETPSAKKLRAAGII